MRRAILALALLWADSAECSQAPPWKTRAEFILSKSIGLYGKENAPTLSKIERGLSIKFTESRSSDADYVYRGSSKLDDGRQVNIYISKTIFNGHVVDNDGYRHVFEIKFNTKSSASNIYCLTLDDTLRILMKSEWVRGAESTAPDQGAPVGVYFGKGDNAILNVRYGRPYLDNSCIDSFAIVKR